MAKFIATSSTFWLHEETTAIADTCNQSLMCFIEYLGQYVGPSCPSIAARRTVMKPESLSCSMASSSCCRNESCFSGCLPRGCDLGLCKIWQCVRQQTWEVCLHEPQSHETANDKFCHAISAFNTFRNQQKHASHGKMFACQSSQMIAEPMTSLLWIYHNLSLETFWQRRFLS